MGCRNAGKSSSQGKVDRERSDDEESIEAGMIVRLARVILEDKGELLGVEFWWSERMGGVNRPGLDCLSCSSSTGRAFSSS